MTMYKTRERGYQDAERDLMLGDAPRPTAESINHLLQCDLAAYYRGYLWCLLDRQHITLDAADSVLREISQPSWKSTWFPRSWLAESGSRPGGYWRR